MKLYQIPLGPLGTNCYIVAKGEKALIIDPGGDSEKLISFFKRERLTPIAILLTHTHFDHIGAVKDIYEQYEIDVFVHTLEANWLSDPTLNGSARFVGAEIEINIPVKTFTIGLMQLQDFTFHVYHTPGHSPGSVTFVWESEKVIIGGDVLFHEGIGRTDLREGDFEQLKESINDVFYTFPNQFTVYPGHGPQATIGHEKENNPFVRLMK